MARCLRCAAVFSDLLRCGAVPFIRHIQCGAARQERSARPSADRIAKDVPAEWDHLTLEMDLSDLPGMNVSFFRLASCLDGIMGKNPPRN